MPVSARCDGTTNTGISTKVGALSLYVLDQTAPNSAQGTLQIGGSPPAVATMTTAWNYPTTAARFSIMVYGSTQGTGTFGSTALPTTANPSTTSCFRTANPLTGIFPAGTWALAQAVVVTGNGVGTGQIRWRVWRSSDPTGAGATELTTATQASGTFNTATAGQQNVTHNWAAPLVSLNNEYLFFEVATQNATGTAAGRVVTLVQDGTNSKVTTAAFWATPTLTSDCTVCFFARIENLGTIVTFFQFSDSALGSSGMEIQTDASGSQVTYISENSGVTINGPVMVENGDWVFLCATLKGSIGTLYWKEVGRSVQMARADFTGTNPFAPGALVIGNELAAAVPDGHSLTGRIAGFRFWTNLILTPAQVELESRQIRARQRVGLTIELDFRQGNGGQYFDKTGNGYNFTAFSATHVVPAAGPPCPDGVTVQRVFAATAATQSFTLLAVPSAESLSALAGTKNLGLAGIPSAESLSRLAGTSQLALPAVGSTQNLSKLGGTTRLAVPSVESTQSVSRLAGASSLALPSVDTAQALSRLAQTRGLSPPGVETTQSVSRLGGTSGLAPPGVGSAQNLSRLAGASGLSPPSVDTTQSLSRLAGASGLSPPGVETAQSVARLARTSGLTLPSIESAQSLSRLAGASGLGPPGIDTAQSLSRLAGASGLGPPGIESTQSVSRLAGASGLALPSVETAQSVSKLDATSALSPPAIPSASELSRLGASRSLTLPSIETAQSVARLAGASGLALPAVPSAEALSQLAETTRLAMPSVETAEGLSRLAAMSALVLPAVPSASDLSRFTGTSRLGPPAIPSGEALSRVAGTGAIAPPAVPSAEALAQIVRAAVLALPAVSSAEMLSAPRGSLTLTLVAIPSGQVLSAPVVAALYSLPSITSAQQVSAPRVTVGPVPRGVWNLLTLGGAELRDDFFFAPEEAARLDPENAEGARPAYAKMADPIFKSALEFLLDPEKALGPPVSTAISISADQEGAPREAVAYLIAPVGAYGADVRSVAVGHIEFILDQGTRGLCAVVRGGDGNRYVHMGLSGSVGESGRWVRAGDVIGKLGKTAIDPAALAQMLSHPTGKKQKGGYDVMRTSAGVSVVFLVLGQPTMAALALLGALVFTAPKDT